MNGEAKSLDSTEAWRHRQRRSGPRAALGLLCLVVLPAASGWSFEIASSAVRYREGRYQFELVALLDASTDKVEAVLRDYQRYPRLDSRILTARVLQRPTSSAAVLETVLRVCFGPFCRNVRRVERVEETPLMLFAVTDPERSDVKFGETRTEMSASGERTQVSYHTSIEPSFWMPPFVGRRWMLRTLQAASIDLFRNVELQAQRLAGEALPAPKASE